MNRNRLLLVIVFLSSILIPALAHGEAGEVGTSGKLEFDSRIVFAGIAAIAVLTLIGVAGQKQLKVKHEKVIFVGIVIASLAVTGYMIGLTAYWVSASESQGPVHWHADYEVWICGEMIELPHSEGLENKVGSAVFHHHNDDRIHIEGIVIELAEVDLGHYFEVIGGEITATSISVPQDLPPDSNPRTYSNGDACPDGNSGALYVFVNGELIENPAEYIIAPFGTVPPGDQIKFVFDDQPAEQINPNLGEAP
jgi:hypothetical protein